MIDFIRETNPIILLCIFALSLLEIFLMACILAPICIAIWELIFPPKRKIYSVGKLWEKGFNDFFDRGNEILKGGDQDSLEEGIEYFVDALKFAGDEYAERLIPTIDMLKSALYYYDAANNLMLPREPTAKESANYSDRYYRQYERFESKMERLIRERDDALESAYALMIAVKHPLKNNKDE
jgi:hypothetical protein